MNSSKKLIALLTALVLLFAAFPLGGLVSRAAEIIEGGDCGKYGDNVTWTLDSDGVLTISGEGDMCSFGWWNKTESSPFYGNSEILFVNIESGVTSIGSEVFSGCTGLKSVMIPDSVTSIGDSAFSGCTRLTDLTVDAKNSVYYSIGNCIIAKETKTLVSGCKNSAIPNDGSVTRIEAGAFSGCAGLQSMTIPDEITSIGGKAFADCTGLMSVTIPDGVTFIGKEAFSGCAGLTSVTIPDSVTKISDSTFSGCSGLTSVTIPNSVTSIGDSAFSGCTGLASLTIPDSVTSIGSSAFSNCTGLTSVTIPDRVTSIEVELFYGCTGLTSVTLPDGVTSIGGNAFFACTSLTSVMIPAGVTSIESSAFSGCTGLSELTVDTNNPVYFSAGNCIIEKEKNSLVIACDNSEIPDDGCVTSIGFGAFSRCTGLNSVKIPEGVTSIGSYAFFGCTGLTSVIIPDSVTRIEWGAFSGCTNLTSLTIPDSVTTISQEMFIDCENLTAITISNDVTRIYKDAFLGTAYYNDKTNWEDGALYLGAALIRVDRETVTENYKIKEGTRIIADNAFECCDSLMSIAIPKSVKNIGDSAFECCSSLTSVMIPDSITSIGGRAFFKCSSLTSVTIPDSVKSIDGSAFYACTNLKSVAIPDSVTSIGGAVFSGCTSLASIFIPESVTEIGWAAIPKSTVIFGYVGSYAQQWAEENDLAFQPIGDVTVTLTVPEVVNEPTVNVHGLANPDAKVICFVNGNETVTVTASASCRWNATIPLTGAKDGDSFTIAAAVTLDGTTAEQTATVTYEPDAVVFHEFTLNHRCYRVTVEGERLGVSIPNITYVPGYPLAFKIRVTNNERIDKLYVVSTKDGDSKQIELTYSAETGYWFATGFFDEADKNYVPGVFTVKGADKDGREFDAGVSVRIRFLIDPSGYAYEAVKSNKLEGVTAAVYYKDAQGHELLWNAETADQLNPIETLSDGAFAWVVPEGQWQVRLTREGYEEARSEWMDVPPEYTDVYLGMTATAAPEVAYFNVWADRAEIVFSQYMKIDSVNAENVTFDGYTGVIAPLDKTETEEGSGVFYARSFAFTPEKAFAGDVAVKVENAVNYAEKAMSDPFAATLSVAAEPKALTVTQDVSVAYGETAQIAVSAENAAGMTVSVVSDSTIVTLSDETLTLDESGKATLTVIGDMPGTTELTFLLNGAALTATAKVTVAIPGVPAEPPVAEPTSEPTTEAPTTTTTPTTTEAPTTTATPTTTEVPTTTALPTVPGVSTVPDISTVPVISTVTEAPDTTITGKDIGSKDPEKAVVNAEKKQVTIQPGQSPDELNALLGDGVTVLGADGKDLDAGKKVGTGCIVKSTDGAEFTVVVPGDTDGDGKVGASDARKALRASAKLDTLDGAYGKAADINADGKTKAADARAILRIAAKLDKITKDILSAM